jgi:hypothetical protein
LRSAILILPIARSGFVLNTPRMDVSVWLAMARARMDLHQIALYAGHASLQTTMLYINLSGVELTQAVTRSLASFEHWIEVSLGEGRS